MAVVLATVVSTYSEHKNEQSFQKLQQEASKIIVTTFRGNPGVLSAVTIEDLVVGDYVLLEPGSLVPADGELTHGALYEEATMLIKFRTTSRQSTVAHGRGSRCKQNASGYTVASRIGQRHTIRGHHRRRRYRFQR